MFDLNLGLRDIFKWFANKYQFALVKHCLSTEKINDKFQRDSCQFRIFKCLITFFLSARQTNFKVSKNVD